MLKEIHYLTWLGNSKHVVHLQDFEHSQLGENTLYMLLEKGECDLRMILKRHAKEQSLTLTKTRFYWEQERQIERLNKYTNSWKIHSFSLKLSHR
jgi:hypothetical protein